MPHAVRVGQGTQHTAGIAHGNAVVRDILGDHAACADDAVVADGHARADHHVGTKPAIIADGDRLRIAKAECAAVLGLQEAALIRQKRMLRCDDGHVGTKVDAVTNGHLAVILNGQVEVAEHILAHGGVAAIVDRDRAVCRRAFTDLRENLFEERRTLFPFIFIGVVEIVAQVVAAQLHGCQVGMTRVVKLAGKDFFFFSHDMFLPHGGLEAAAIYPDSL